MLPAYKRRMTIAGVIFAVACAAAVLVASASTPRDPGLGMKVAPLLGMGGGWVAYVPSITTMAKLRVRFTTMKRGFCRQECGNSPVA